ncbi:MAG: PASTA domain-containing protein [Deltaproteobacteria bacterium]|nr:PASTA domain-containing protein [Deltaproteobacteria bacterium]
MRSQALRSAAVRARALRLVFILAFMVLASRAGYLAVGQPRAADRGGKQTETEITLRGARGLILDRSGRELAISVDAPSVFVFPRLLENRQRAIADLARALGVSRRELEERIGSRTRFTYLARWLEDDRAQAVEALGLPGVGVEREARRTYPAGGMAAQLVGFADIDGKGVRGIEQMYDEWLRGSVRKLPLKRDARGVLLSSHAFDSRENAGGDIMLSLHAGLQAQAEAALAEAVTSTKAKGGVVIAVDPRNGDILSLAEAPGFDPNDFRHTPYAQTRSRAFMDALEPGSTMKAFLVAAALENGVISVTTAFDTGEGWIRVPGRTIRDHHPYGVINAAGVLRYSSNIGAVLIAGELGPERHHAALGGFGFGHATRSGFPTESAGLLRDWPDWKGIDHATVAFGQGMNVTPIQLAMATAALANGGLRMQPRLVLARRRPMSGWEDVKPVGVGQAVSPAVAAHTLSMLETVVSGEGTGRRAALAGVRVAGKTGTAQIFDTETGHYSQTRYTAWFLGIAPADDPRIAIVVALHEPQGPSHTGGGTAAPLFARVAADQLARFGITTEPEPIAANPNPRWKVAMKEREEQRRSIAAGPSAPGAAEAARALTIASGPTPESRAPAADRIPVPSPAAGARKAIPHVSTSPPATIEAGRASAFVPDFHGESLTSAKEIAAGASLKLQVSGLARGRVVRQSPVAGTIVDGKQRTVVLRFSTEREEG